MCTFLEFIALDMLMCSLPWYLCSRDEFKDDAFYSNPFNALIFRRMHRKLDAMVLFLPAYGDIMSRNRLSSRVIVSQPTESGPYRIDEGSRMTLRQKGTNST